MSSESVHLIRSLISLGQFAINKNYSLSLSKILSRSKSLESSMQENEHGASGVTSAGFDMTFGLSAEPNMTLPHLNSRLVLPSHNISTDPVSSITRSKVTR